MENNNEQKAAELLKKANVTTTDKGASKTAYYRKKKAEDSVQGYKAILADKALFVEEGGDASEYTATVAVERLVAQLEAKAEMKDSEAI